MSDGTDELDTLNDAQFVWLLRTTLCVQCRLSEYQKYIIEVCIIESTCVYSV